jgi:hypothetical protein
VFMRERLDFPEFDEETEGFSGDASAVAACD